LFLYRRYADVIRGLSDRCGVVEVGLIVSAKAKPWIQ
jgi:hypothetical protein